MTKYREILRLASLGLSQQNIADSSGVSKKTVNRVLKRAKELNIFGLHPEGVAPKWCQQEAPLDGIPGGMPPVR